MASGIAVALCAVRKEKPMLQDAISILVLLIVPLLGIFVFRRIAKTKRQRRPVHTFRLK
jgi:hypothetical protein